MASIPRNGSPFAALSALLGNIEGRGTAFRIVALPVLTAAAVIWLWDRTVDAGIFPTVMLPPPADVVTMLTAQSGFMFGHAEKTFYECLAGFAIAAVTGIGLATLITVSRIWREMLYPNLVMFQLIPTIALGPLFALWFGVGPQSRLSYAMCLALFPIVVSASTGLMNTNPYFVRLCDSLTASKWQILLQVRFPFALPHIFTGLRIGLTLAIIGVVVGEFITAQSGIGYLIGFASASMETAVALAAILFLLAVGLVLFLMLLVLEYTLNHVFSAHG